jgi:hypothetical protein
MNGATKLLMFECKVSTLGREVNKNRVEEFWLSTFPPYECSIKSRM